MGPENVFLDFDCSTLGFMTIFNKLVMLKDLLYSIIILNRLQVIAPLDAYQLAFTQCPLLALNVPDKLDVMLSSIALS